MVLWLTYYPIAVQLYGDCKEIPEWRVLPTTKVKEASSPGRDGLGARLRLIRA